MILNFIFFLAKGKSLNFIQNEITIFKIFQGNENLSSWLPHLFTIFQKSCRSIKNSNCLALRLLGGSQLRLTVQTGLLSLQTFTSPLLWEHQGVWCHTGPRPLHWVWEVRGSNNLPGVWQRLPCFWVVRVFHKTLVFQVIPVLKSWNVFREICFSHLSLEKKKKKKKRWVACAASLPLDVSVLNSTQRLNWFLSFHLLSSSEEHF